MRLTLARASHGSCVSRYQLCLTLAGPSKTHVHSKMHVQTHVPGWKSSARRGVVVGLRMSGLEAEWTRGRVDLKLKSRSEVNKLPLANADRGYLMGTGDLGSRSTPAVDAGSF